MRDLTDIADFYRLRRQNPSAAEKVISAIRTACRSAAGNAKICLDRSELRPGLRSKLVFEYPYIIYFRSAAERLGARIEVVRILHQARDVEMAFREFDDAGR